MGLDQYLCASKYIGAWNHSTPMETVTYDAIIANLKLNEWKCAASPHLTVDVSAAYWRKANQIHAWFVENVQGGDDDCKEYDVSREQLIQLRNTCQQVMDSTCLVDGKICVGITWEKEKEKRILEDGKIMANSALAEELLPTQDGFFFGSTEYDQFYWEDLEYTVKQIDKILEVFGEDWYFKYRSSW